MIRQLQRLVALAREQHFACAAKTIGLVIADHDPIPVLIQAFWEHVERLDFPGTLAFPGETS